MSATPSELSALSTRAAEGDEGARQTLMSELYEHLRAIAHNRMRAERAGHTLSPTALVHEAFLKLVDQTRAGLNDRAHFLAIASMAMRRVLVSHARARSAAKRGDGRIATTFSDQIEAGAIAVDDMVSIDVALERLAALSERQAQVVSYRAFGGMTDDEIAKVVGVSVPTVRRDYRLATAWLRRELSP